MSIIGSNEFIYEIGRKEGLQEAQEKDKTKFLNYLISKGRTKEEAQKVLNNIFSEDVSET